MVTASLEKSPTLTGQGGDVVETLGEDLGIGLLGGKHGDSEDQKGRCRRDSGTAAQSLSNSCGRAGTRLRKITALIDAGVIRPVVDRIFPFESTGEAMTDVEAGRAKGKVVVKVR